MSAVWQVQEAKNRFSEMIEQALSTGPQTITRHGRAVVRVVAASDAAGKAPGPTLPSSSSDDGFSNYLLSAPSSVEEIQLPPRRSRKARLSLGG